MHIIYRYCASRGKDRPDWFSKAACWRSLLANVLLATEDKITIIVDGAKGGQPVDAGLRLDLVDARLVHFHNILAGNGGAAFRGVLNFIGVLPPEEWLYLVEDDYLHRPGARAALNDGIDAGRFDFLTLYDHPDKYLIDGPNPLVSFDGSEETRVYLTPTCHWRLTNSTTMTFACRALTIQNDMDIWRACNQGQMPSDFQTFMSLFQKRGRCIGSPVPSYATHCEAQWLAPLVDWEKQALQWTQRTSIAKNC